MQHEMKLQPEYFNFILNGTKRIEIRLNDEKRQLIKLGDTIKFMKEPELNESFNTKVVGLLKYNSFEDMFKDFDISVLSDKSMTKEEVEGIIDRIEFDNMYAGKTEKTMTDDITYPTIQYNGPAKEELEDEASYKLEILGYNESGFVSSVKITKE